jgi:hypothetical protein
MFLSRADATRAEDPKMLAVTHVETEDTESVTRRSITANQSYVSDDAQFGDICEDIQVCRLELSLQRREK